MIWKFPRESILKKNALFVQSIIDERSIQITFDVLSNPESLRNEIRTKILYRPQFLLAGYNDSSSQNQVFVFGKEEVDFLQSLNVDQQITAFSNIFDKQVACIIISNSLVFPDYILELLNNRNVALLSTDKDISVVFDVLTSYFNDQFSPQMVVHGTLVDVYGVGILLYGKSSIGKSEVALDLVERGHRLVADDTVMLTNNADATIMGTSTRIAKHFMEIRGIGVIDVRSMFGIKAVRFQKRMEIVIELVEYDPNEEYTRTGLEQSFAEIMGVRMDYIKLPVYHGKNVTVIAEAIALNYLLRTYGYNPAKIMSDYLHSVLQNEPIHEDKFSNQRLVNYFQGDRE
jgi:HPr kinase/phosphorylase